MFRKWMLRVMALAVVATAACDAEPTTGVVGVDRVEVGAEGAVLLVGDTVRVTATPRAANGSIVANAPVQWQADNPASATLSATGATARLVGRAPGTVRVRASAGGRQGAVEITVVAASAVVASVRILPQEPVVQVPGYVLLEAVALAADGSVIEGRPIAWSSADTAKATIGLYQATSYGELRARGAGTVQLRAVIDGVSAEVTATIVPAPPLPVRSVNLLPGDTLIDIGQQYTLQAELRAADGSIIDGRTVSWHSTNSYVATVDANGTVRAVASGFTTLRATVEGVVAEARLQVRPPQAAVGFVVIRPSPLSIYVNQQYPYGPAVAVLDHSGRPLTGRAVSWMVEDSTIASIDSAGTVRGLRAGETRVRAVSGGVSGYATLVVFAPPTDDAQYDYTLDWWDGQYHLAPQVGQTTWTDSTGTHHDVKLYLVSGTLVFGRSGMTQTYERALVLEGWVTIGFYGRKVVEQILVDRGTVGIIVGGETGYNFFSATRPGHVYQGVGTSHAGQLLVRDAIGTAPLAGYMFRLKQ